MALNLEEQEQLAELKAWWQSNGGMIVLVVCAAAIAFSGWQGWHWYQRSQAVKASTLYETLQRAAAAGDTRVVREADGELVADYSRTIYASIGALTTARYEVDHGDPKNAKAQLEWVIERSHYDNLRDIARLRLAAILLDGKAYDAALQQLAAPHAAAYDAQYAALRGDVLYAKKQPGEAKAAYRSALEKADAGDAAFRERVRVRLEALGG